MHFGVSEIFQKVEEAKTKNEKVNILQKYDSPVIRDILRLYKDKNMKWLLPDGVPPYNKNEQLDNQGNLYSSWRRMYLFVPNPNAGEMPSLKRESLFIQFLEQLDPLDAALLCSVKDKKFPYKITDAVFEAAYPGIFDPFKTKKAKSKEAAE